MAKAQKQDQEAKIVGYKGFDKDLCCRGFQFEIGKTYKVEGKITACENGFHACTNPFDVWSYYEIMDSNAKLNRFAIVEQSGDIGRHADDSKVASAEITIKAELKLPEFVKAAVQWIIDATKDKSENSSGDFARIGSSGHSARIVSEGNKAVIACAGSATVSAKMGSWISLAEFDERGECIGFASGCVGKDGLKPDTAYIAKGGRLVEVK